MRVQKKYFKLLLPSVNYVNKLTSINYLINNHFGFKFLFYYLAINNHDDFRSLIYDDLYFWVIKIHFDTSHHLHNHFDFPMLKVVSDNLRIFFEDENYFDPSFESYFVEFTHLLRN